MAFIYAAYHNYVYINPSTIFLIGFLVAVGFCIVYKEEWGIESLHFNTFIIILLGVLVFSAICFWLNRKYDLSNLEEPDLAPIDFSIRNSHLIAFIVFVFLISLWEYKAKIAISGSYDIGEALTEFDADFKKGDREMELPMLLRNLVLLRTCICLYFFYIFSKMLALKVYGKKFYLISVVCIFGVVGGFLSGSRGNALTFVLYSFFVWSIYKARYFPEFRILRLKKVLSYLIVAGLSGTVFVKSTEWVGRSLYGFDDASYYFAVYCGAEIKNLDIYLNEDQTPSKHIGEYTFSGISVKDDESRERALDHIQFRDYDGYFLGNVYTCFQNYYQDFGYVGVVVLVGLMAFIMQSLFLRSLMSEKLYKKHFDFILFLYAYLSTLVVFSFFSERFYGALSWYTIKLFIELLILSIVMNRLLEAEDTTETDSEIECDDNTNNSLK